MATQGIRGGANRKVLERIKETGEIFWAQSDRNWILDGAAVNVSMIGFDDGTEEHIELDNRQVTRINPNLSSIVDLTSSHRLQENFVISFIGPSPHGTFDIDNSIAQKMLISPNVNGMQNSDVVRPVISSIDICQAPRGLWTIDFGLMPLDEASKYEMPFEYLKKNVYPFRQKNRRAAYAVKWWQYAEARPGMRDSINGKSRFIATPRISKHRIFVWLSFDVLGNDGTTIFAREDDYFFGVLHSRPHELWGLRLGTALTDRPRYTPTTTFETFPFPWPPGQEPWDDPHLQAISSAAKELVHLRDNWLEPSWPIPRRAKKAHPHQPLQPASNLVGPSASQARSSRLCCVWLAL